MAAIVAAILLPLSSLCERTKNILVPYRENPRLPGNIVATNAIQETIGQNLQYQVFDEYIEETRLETDFQTLAERIQQKDARQPIDLIMTVGLRPFTFMRRKFFIPRAGVAKPEVARQEPLSHSSQRMA
jgi:hypothetical protein